MTIVEWFKQIIAAYGEDAIVHPNSNYIACSVGDKTIIKFYDQDDFGEINYVRRT